MASIATKENEKILANQAKILSKSALETFVKDEKKFKTEAALPQEQNGSFETKNEVKSVSGQTSRKGNRGAVNSAMISDFQKSSSNFSKKERLL